MQKQPILLLFLLALFLACSENNEVQSTTESINRGGSQRSIMHDGIQRTYYLYVPQSYTEGTELPLMLNFHGFSDNAIDQMNSADMRPLAESENFILVYPQGTLLGGLPHWNPDPVGGNNKSSADDLGFVEALINTLKQEMAIDTNRVYASGYSNGGYFVYGLACRLSNKIAAVGSVAGTMLEYTYDNCEASAPLSVINFHGTADYYVPYNGTTGLKSAADVIEYWSDFNQAENLEITQNSGFDQYEYTDAGGDTYVRHFKIIDGGHTWNDNDSYGGKSSSQLVWEFVSRFNLSGLIQ
tara:strand:- start:1163 stop:2056 length:894 start_codon:yes stop_codon:yes gene_type:complete